MMPFPAFHRYVGAVLLLALATLLRWALHPVLGEDYPLVTYFGAALLAVWYGGFGPAAVVFGGGVLLDGLWFYTPQASLWSAQLRDWVGSGLYLATAVAAIALAGSLRAAKVRAEAAERCFRRLLEIGSVGVAIAEPGGRVCYANPAVLEMLGYTAEEVETGRVRWDQLTPPECIGQSANAIQALRENRAVAPYEKEYIAKDGRRVPVLIGLTALERMAQGEPLLAAFVTDLSSLRQTEKALERQKAQFEAIFNSAVTAISFVDLQQRIVLLNPAFTALFGYVAEEVVGQTTELLYVSPDDYLEQGLRRHHVGAAADTHPLEVRCRRKDGTLFWAESLGTPVVDADGSPVGFLSIHHDITERKQAEAERERLLSRLAEADRRKDAFLATLAHELRNPLAPIRNAFELIKRAVDKPAVIRSALAVGERQVGQLVRLVDDLLDIARITHGTIPLRKERVTLEAVLQSALETARPQIEAGAHRLSVEAPAAPVWLEADLTRLAQAITNLLANAAKYTDPGGHIRLMACRERDEVVITVQDDGIGIPVERLDEVFEPFIQLEPPQGQIARGLGVGLALVKSLVELHGGRVEAASPGVGQGSTFTLRLPGVIASPVEAPPVAAAAPVRSRRILVVDDDRDVADSMAMLLTTCGHEVRTAYDGAAALALAPRYRPEAVLLDLGMPGMDGYAVARALRQRPELHETLIVALTGWGQEEDRRRSREAGFDHHLAKPAAPEALEAVLRDRKTAYPYSRVV